MVKQPFNISKEIISNHRALSLRLLKLQDMFDNELRTNTNIKSYQIVCATEPLNSKKYVSAIKVYINKESMIKFSRYFVCGYRKGKNHASCSFVATKDVENDMRRALMFLNYLE